MFQILFIFTNEREQGNRGTTIIEIEIKKLKQSIKKEERKKPCCTGTGEQGNIFFLNAREQRNNVFEI